MIIQLLIVLFAVALDRVTKIWMLDFLTGKGGYQALWPDVFSLTLVENRGAAFGMLQGGRWFFIAVTIVVIAVVIVYSIISRKKTSWLFKVSTAMIIGGAIGNLIDRIDAGVVLDFFYFELINFAVFNVADSFVTVGAVLLGISILFLHDFDDEPKIKNETKSK